MTDYFFLTEQSKEPMGKRDEYYSPKVPVQAICNVHIITSFMIKGIFRYHRTYSKSFILYKIGQLIYLRGVTY